MIDGVHVDSSAVGVWQNLDRYASGLFYYIKCNSWNGLNFRIWSSHDIANGPIARNTDENVTHKKPRPAAVIRMDPNSIKFLDSWKSIRFVSRFVERFWHYWLQYIPVLVDHSG
jgi:hypothetical protein